MPFKTNKNIHEAIFILEVIFPREVLFLQLEFFCSQLQFFAYNLFMCLDTKAPTVSKKTQIISKTLKNTTVSKETQL